jgi:hypothetical protein
MASVRDISSKNISAFLPNLQKQASKETKKSFIYSKMLQRNKYVSSISTI